MQAVLLSLQYILTCILFNRYSVASQVFPLLRAVAEIAEDIAF